MEIIAYGVLADEKPLLQEAIDQAFGSSHELRCLELFLNRDTAPTAAGHEVVLSSVNDTLNADVLHHLAKGGTRMIAQRATGYNNIDLAAAQEHGLTVARVSYYSPHSVAKFAGALALAVNRRIVRAAHRTREFDFRLDGLMGRDLHCRTAGVAGTGKIGTVFARIAPDGLLIHTWMRRTRSLMIKVLEAFDHEQVRLRAPSSLIDVLQRHREDADLLHLPAGLSELAALSEVLDRLPDPLRVQGRRYQLGSLLALCLLAVLGGATTLGRLLSRLDGDALDDAVGAWLARHASDPADEGTVELVGVAVDGKAVRGSRTGEKTAVHLLAAVLHEGQAVISQRQIAA
ncbi:NAD(P)-dependent oxidoreductase [Streptomyces sp. NPDC127097]|uniref:NAD(P)-dependent oxidoreductase n=1 Tax=Streptomyces sp. NPDC127097 TaxID=3347136 RepID=UPI0036595F2A